VFLLDTLLLAPGKAVLLMFEELAKKAQEEFLDDASVKQELQEIYGLLEGGTISETEFEAREGRLLERLEQIARAKFGGEWGTSAMGMQRSFMDSDPAEDQDVSMLDAVTEGEIVPDALSTVERLLPAGASTDGAGDGRPVMDLDVMSALRPLLERFVSGQGRQTSDPPAALLPAPAAAVTVAPPMAPAPEVVLREAAPTAAETVIAALGPAMAAALAPAMATVSPPVATAVAPPIAGAVTPAIAGAFVPPIASPAASPLATGFASAVAPAVTPPVAAAVAPPAAATFAPSTAPAVAPPAAAPVSTPALTMMQVVESSLRQLSMLKMKVSAITAVARSDDGWRVTAEMLERRGVPDTSDLLGVYELQLDEAGNVLRYERTHIRRRCDLGR
jgi:hypothetical protein